MEDIEIICHKYNNRWPLPSMLCKVKQKLGYFNTNGNAGQNLSDPETAFAFSSSCLLHELLLHGCLTCARFRGRQGDPRVMMTHSGGGKGQ